MNRLLLSIFTILILSCPEKNLFAHPKNQDVPLVLVFDGSNSLIPVAVYKKEKQLQGSYQELLIQQDIADLSGKGAGFRKLPIGITPLILQAGGQSGCPSFTTIYVDSSSSGGDGSSWGNAMKTLSEALAMADSCNGIEHILVAKGTYYPTGSQSGLNRDSAFCIFRGGLKLYGGYPSGGGIRDVAANTTLLSGDIGLLGDSSDNSYHVMIIAGIDSIADSVIVDGFQIVGAKGDGPGTSIFGGISIARNKGGGMCLLEVNNHSKTCIKNCNFYQNSAGFGGGIYSEFAAAPVFVNCKVAGNTAQSGGGLYSDSAALQFYNALFSGNKVSNKGSAWFCGSNDSVLFLNATFAGNKADFGGGGTIYMLNSDTFQKVRLINSIVWNNSSSIVGGLHLFQTIVEGGSNAGWDWDPLFSAPESEGQAPTLLGDYQLSDCSPAIDAGDSSYLPSWMAVDLVNQDRKFGSNVDLGAFESQSDLFSGHTLYVDSSIAVSGDGNSWGAAMKTLSEAFIKAAQCSSVDSILVAKGTYYPTGNQNATDRKIAFSVIGKRLKVYGGFAPGGGVRNVLSFPSVMSGNIGSASDSSDNSYHVLVVGNVDSAVDSMVVDGFSIQEGLANVSGYTSYSGVSVANDKGAGAFITGNAASVVLINNVKIIHNGAVKGAGIYNSKSKSVFTRLIVAGNASEQQGGGVYCYQSDPDFINCLVSGNRSGNDGAGFYNSNADPKLTNVTIAGNYTAADGAGIYNTSSSTPIVKNAIIFGNTSGIKGNADSVSYSLVQGLTSSANGNLSGVMNPKFAYPYNDSFAPTTFGDYRLLSCSPCINKGNSSYNNASFDLNGNSRIFAANVDMGAHEFQDDWGYPTDTLKRDICFGDSSYFGGIYYLNSGDYVDTIKYASGCDSIYILNLQVHAAPITLPEQTIDSCGWVTFEGNVYFTDTIVKDTLYSGVAGCDSVYRKMNIKVYHADTTLVDSAICEGNRVPIGVDTFDASGLYTVVLPNHAGCDSVITLNLMVHPIFQDTLKATICQGSGYSFNGQTYMTTGIYTDSFQTMFGCDSVVTLNLLVHPIFQDTLKATICQGSGYSFNGQTYMTTGIYTDSFQTIFGCDSVVTLNLMVHPIFQDTLNAAICQGYGYSFNGQAYTTAGFYTDSFQTVFGCDSIVTLNLMVHPIFQDTLNSAICQGSSHSFNGQNYTTSGFYTDSFQTVFGCDSVVTLNLLVHPNFQDTLNAAICQGSSYLFNGQTYMTTGIYTDSFQTIFGCDSVVTLNLMVHPIFQDTISSFICQGSSYLFNGQTYTTTGFYTDSFQTIFGCDSVVTLNLLVHPIFQDTISSFICQGSSYSFNGQNYSAAGFYTDTFQTVFGCDSIVTLNLLVHPIFQDTLNAAICQGSSYSFNGQTYSATGFYTDSFHTNFGCDSVVTLNLMVHPIFHDTLNASICQGLGYLFNGQTYTTTGFYTDSFQTIFGCDSVVTLNLLVHPIFQDTISSFICEGSSYLFNGQTYTTSGFYTDSFQTVFGCDSIVTLNLIVHPIFQDTLSAAICQGSSYSCNGQIYTTSGFYTDSFQTVFGCDSIITLNLLVHPTFQDTLNAAICQGSSYLFNGQTYTTAGFYTDSFQTIFGCDSVVMLNLIVHPIFQDTLNAAICQGSSYLFNGQNYSAAGFYTDSFQTVFGCDSVVTLNLIVHPIFHDTLSAAICHGSGYSFNGQTYTTAGFYTDSFQTVFGCDSIVTLNLLLHQIFHDTLNAAICQGSGYSFNGKTYTATGIYTDSFQTVFGCDSVVTLNLLVHTISQDTLNVETCHGSGYSFNGQIYITSGFYTDSFQTVFGCDSVVTLNLIVHPIFQDTVNAAICQGSSYSFNGQNYSAAGFYTDSFHTVFGCDSIITLNLLVHPIFHDTLNAAICHGSGYLFNGQTYTTSGFYTDSFQTVFGCDSVVTLNLLVHPNFQDTLNAAICQGSSYLFNGQNYSAAGFYTDSFQTVFGCDSVVTLNLLVHPIFQDTLNASICQGLGYLFNGQTYMTSGFYTDSFQTVFGCDSVVTLNLLVHPIFHDTLNAAICHGSSYLFNGQTYSTTGIYTDSFQTIFGCDSVVTLNLLVHPIFQDTLNAAICQGSSYLFNGQTYSTTGIYTDSLQTIFGCDSVVTLNLIVHPIFQDTLNAAICQGSSYSFNGQTYTTTGIYTDSFQTIFGCDSVVTLNLLAHPTFLDTLNAAICQGSSYLFNGQNYTTAGFYTDTFQTVFGCDSVVTLQLIQLPDYEDTLTVSVCDGDSFLLNGQNYYSSGNYIDTLSSVDGCDSIIHLSINVLPSAQYFEFDTAACGGLYFEGNYYNQTSQIYDTLYNANGCDSIYRHIQIVIWNNAPIVKEMDSVSCEQVDFNGQIFYQDTTITQVYRDVHGCDSLLWRTKIHVLHGVRDTSIVDICEGDGFLFNENRLTETGIYTAVYPYWNGCDSTSVLKLTVHIAPDLKITADPEVGSYCVGDEMMLKGSGAARYQWWTGFGKDYGSNEDVYVTLMNQKNIFLMAGFDAWNCVDTATITVHAEYCCALFIPNAFTPNNDLKNDYFGVETNGNPKTFRMEIFNRLGKRIFVAFSVEEHWSGLIDGKPADMGIYYYKISGICADGSHFNRSGSLTLLR